VARSQVFGELDGRPIVRESTLAEYSRNAEAGNELHKEIEKKHVSLYAEPKYDGFHWGLSVDLNSCTGCSACVIACQAENNIPVVGKTEVSKFRIMHWIRIDRYYTGDPEQPDVVHQPVMCMHCDNAPCENVCPVSATPHNNEGLNQVAYTRCIGTKYCINNCPYKVRKFNWFQYAQNPKFNYNKNSDLGRLVLNPDVTVRERGVVEKCSFCAQRIQEKKLTAKLENRVLNGEEVQPACVQSCPAKALVFGDLNNPGNAVTQLAGNERNYYLLEELHTLPSVGYLTKIRNRNT
jgi:molybdopterin-containing oxidoreductase family iron-sulfur binding subunit